MKRVLLLILCVVSVIHVDVGAAHQTGTTWSSESAGEWHDFWWGLSDSIRSRYTEDPSQRLRGAYERIVLRARAFGFVFRTPKLLQTTADSTAHIQSPEDVYYGGYFFDDNLIVIDGSLSSPMTEQELEVLLAHELGHCIDLQSKRIGHRAFEDTSAYKEQQFADYIAMLLVDIDAVARFNKAYVYIKVSQTATPHEGSFSFSVMWV